MKINEIIMEMGPEGLAAERQRAQAEIRLLQQIDFNFAAQFEKSFRKYGKKSVDTAYQAAIADGQKSGTISGSEAEKLKSIAGNTGLSAAQRTKQFVSALPQEYKKSLPNVTYAEPDKIGRGKYQFYRDGSARGGQDSFVDPDAKSGVRKAIDKTGQTVKDIWKGARASKGLQVGSQLGQSLSTLSSNPVKTARRTRSI